MSDQDKTASVGRPGERNAWLARVLGVDVGAKLELKQDYDPNETRPPPNRPPPEPPTQTTGRGPPNRPLPPLPQRDPNRELFGKELIAVEGRLEYLRDAESSNEKVKAAQGDLTGSMAEMDKAAGEKRYGDARKHLGTAKGHADRVEKALEEAGKSERDFMIDYHRASEAAGARFAAADGMDEEGQG
jgi:hypothetical protein